MEKDWLWMVTNIYSIQHYKRKLKQESSDHKNKAPITIAFWCVHNLLVQKNT